MMISPAWPSEPLLTPAIARPTGVPLVVAPLSTKHIAE